MTLAERANVVGEHGEDVLQKASKKKGKGAPEWDNISALSANCFLGEKTRVMLLYITEVYKVPPKGVSRLRVSFPSYLFAENGTRTGSAAITLK